MWQVRLTVSGSSWIWRYNKLRGVGKGAPTNAPTSGRVEWDAWLTAKIAWDRYQATIQANEWNRRDQGFLSPNQPQTAPPDPGPMPQDLILAMGQETPVFANVVKPMAHTIKFEDDEITYADNPVMRQNYAYYRFEQGVMSAGVPLGKIPEADMARIAEKAKINGSIARVMVAISPLEGGFDSVNTYDTGFVSVGFIQFACLKDGAGSLGGALNRFKQNDPAGFAADFRRFGIEVAQGGALIALDPASGEEKVGPDAAEVIINDKRLIAVFQRAGRRDGFRVAQMQIAKERYYPSEDVVQVPTTPQIQVRVADIFRSEAGLATLMDRKVNTGKLDPLPSLMAKIWKEFNLQDPMDLAAFEPQMIVALKFRGNYLGKEGLTQPDPSRCRPLDRKL